MLNVEIVSLPSSSVRHIVANDIVGIFIYDIYDITPCLNCKLGANSVIATPLQTRAFVIFGNKLPVNKHSSNVCILVLMILFQSGGCTTK